MKIERINICERFCINTRLTLVILAINVIGKKRENL